MVVGTEKLGIEVKLVKEFPIVKETLERMGIKSHQNLSFYPSCYIVEDENNEYNIMHFKELFIRDGKTNTYRELDRLRRDTIVALLVKWGLVELANKGDITEILKDRIDVLPKVEKEKWTIIHKYRFIKRYDDFE